MTSMENKKGYKKTKLGWIPEEWEVKSLNSVAEEIVDCEHKTPTFSNDKYGFYVRTKNIKNGRLIYEDSKYVDATSFKIWTQRGVPKPGNILFTREAPAGELALVPADEKVCLGQRMVLIIENKELLNSRFFINAFYSYLTQIFLKKIFVGTTVMRLNMADIRKLPVLLPPLPEQQKIATILSTWDKAIDRIISLIAAKEEQKKGLMQRLLTGKVRLKGFEDEWNYMKLGEIFEERRETGFTDMQLLSIGSRGVYPQSESNKKDTSNNNKDKYKRICKGDIGYNTMRMWQGRSAISTLEGIVSPAYTIVTPKKDHDVNFYGYLFRTPDLIHRFWRYSQGLVGDTLNCKFNSFSKVKVLVPPTIEEQRQISEVLDQISAEIKILEEKRDIYEIEKKGLMQQLLTGKTRVKL